MVSIKIHGSECVVQVVDVLEVEGLTSVFRYWTFRLHFGIARNVKSNQSPVNVGPRCNIVRYMI